MLNFYKKMRSNTLAGSANQTFFYTDDPEREYVGRVFYKVFAGGKYAYAFSFSGRTDSSFPIENVTSCDTPVLGWEIVSARVGVASACDMEVMPDVDSWQDLTFDGRKRKRVLSVEEFSTDEVKISARKGEYICLEIAYKGEKIPHHYENSIPAFERKEGKWTPSNRAVFASMVGCDRPTKKKIAFLGDSITQGLGVPPNGYRHWCAMLADALGEEYAYWNLGIGFGMANDCVIGRSWLEKAKQNDLVVVCFGVNDLARIRNVERTKEDLLRILQILKGRGCKVLLQTVPPCNPTPQGALLWEKLNEFIKGELQEKADLVFDVTPFLQADEKIGGAKYGVHPSEEGCAIWAEALYPAVRALL